MKITDRNNRPIAKRETDTDRWTDIESVTARGFAVLRKTLYFRRDKSAVIIVIFRRNFFPFPGNEKRGKPRFRWKPCNLPRDAFPMLRADLESGATASALGKMTAINATGSRSIVRAFQNWTKPIKRGIIFFLSLIYRARRMRNIDRRSSLSLYIYIYI